MNAPYCMSLTCGMIAAAITVRNGFHNLEFFIFYSSAALCGLAGQLVDYMHAERRSKGE
jgi:hypothetical protein